MIPIARHSTYSSIKKIPKNIENSLLNTIRASGWDKITVLSQVTENNLITELSLNSKNNKYPRQRIGKKLWSNKRRKNKLTLSLIAHFTGISTMTTRENLISLLLPT